MATWRTEFEQLLRPHLRMLNPEEPLISTKPLADLGLDSLETVTVLIELEQKFGVVFPDAALVPETFATAEALSGMLAELMDDSNHFREGG